MGRLQYNKKKKLKKEIKLFLIPNTDLQGSKLKSRVFPCFLVDFVHFLLWREGLHLKIVIWLFDSGLAGLELS